MNTKKTVSLFKEHCRLIARLFAYSKSFRAGYITALLINAFTMIRFSFVIGFSVQWVTDSAIAQNRTELRHALIFAGCAFVLNSVLYYFEGYLMHTRAELIMGRIKEELMKKVLNLPPGYHDKHHSAQLQSRLANDLELVQQSVSFTLVDPVNFISLGLVNLLLILTVSWEMAVFCLGLVTFVLLINSLFLRPVYRSSERIQHALSAAAERFSDMVRSVPVIRMYQLEGWTSRRYDTESRQTLKHQNELNHTASGQKAINRCVEILCTVGVLGAGSLFMSKGLMTAGGLLAAFRYASQLVRAFTGFGWVLSNLSQSLIGAKRLFEILDLPGEREENTTSYAPQNSGSVMQTGAAAPQADVFVRQTHGPLPQTAAAAPAVEWKGVSFHYVQDRHVIKKLSGTVQTGEQLALVGPSGSGKTTLLHLLMGFTKPSEGEIKLFGQKLAEMSSSEIEQLLAHVPQTPYLFSGSIMDNIRCGRLEAKDGEVLEAAREAGADKFIQRLPDGYDTQLGSGGTGLSGGEIQRITIARALLKNAPILLLDEPTSALDSISEQNIQAALERLRKGRTVISAAHRLSTVSGADRILMLEPEAEAEWGTHEQLVARGGRYARMARLLYG